VGLDASVVVLGEAAAEDSCLLVVFEAAAEAASSGSGFQ
jgi:hypothetical protein